MADQRAHDKLPYESVEQVERDGTSSPSGPTARKRTAKEKLGTYNIVVLSIGTLVILLAIGFLAFIWAVSINNLTSGHLPRLWKLIVTKRWVSRVVTLSAILIRIATAAQLCVFAAIMAALILERVGASAQDFPLLSMIRCANTGPQALIWNVIRTMKTGTQWGYSILIVLTILNAFALQFTSTLLLFDLGYMEVVLNDTNVADIHFALSQDDLKTNPYAGVDFWKTGPQSYPRFAEYKEAGSNGTNFTDTGKTYRGFLPFPSPDDRNVLRSYTGPMEVVDIRVVCVKPKLSKLSMYPDENDGRIISGTLDARDVYSAINTKTANETDQQYVSTQFNCTAPMVNTFQDSTVGNASLCLLGVGYGELLDGIIPDPEDNSLVLGHTFAQLFINGTKIDYWDDVAPDNLTTLTPMESSAPSWAKFGNENVTFDLSLCYFNPMPQDYRVTAWTNASWTDSFTFWDNSTGNATLDTSDVRFMLDATLQNYTSLDRGLLEIKPPANWTAEQANLVYKVDPNSFLMDSLMKADTSDILGDTYQLTPWVVPQDAMHRSHSTLVSDILRDTNNPAVALQSLWTVLLQMAYYDFSGDYTLHAPAKYGAAVQYIIPWRWTFFAAIVSLLGLHLVLVATALVLFVTRTEMSLLGNAWQAVSQVMSTDTANTIHHGAMATDQEVTKTVQESHGGEGTFLVAKSATSGRTEAMSVARRR